MPPYWDNKALPTPTQYFIFNFSIISFIFIESKCLSDVTWDLKREEKKVGKDVGRVENDYATMA